MSPPVTRQQAALEFVPENDIIPEAPTIPSTEDFESPEITTPRPASPIPKSQEEPVMNYAEAAALYNPQPQGTQADGDVYGANKRRSLTLWMNTNISPRDLAEAVAKSLGRPINACLVGLERDTRVKTKYKYTLVFKTDDVAHEAADTGVTVEGRRYQLRSPTPRPPPRKRAFLPNFPVAATPELLDQCLKEAGIQQINITPRTLPDSVVRIGGWVVYATLDSAEPDVVEFDGSSFAILWNRKTNSKRQNTMADHATTTDNPVATATDNAVTTTETNALVLPSDNAEQQVHPMENHKSTQPSTTTSKPSETSTEEENFQEVTTKRRRKKKVPAASLRNAKNAKETSANKHALNETTRDNTKRKSPVIRADRLDDVKVKDNQVLFYNFPQDTPIVSMLASLNQRGINATSSMCSLVSIKRDLPAVMVDFDDADAAYVQTILAHDRKYTYELGDGDRHDIFARCIFGDSDDRALQTAYEKYSKL